MLARCAGTPQPPSPRPRPEIFQEKAIGTLRVTATTLNVRREASPSGEVVAQVRKGDRLTLLAAGDEWNRVRLADGTVGFVAVLHVIREGASRSRRGCAPDSEFSFVKAPLPSFSENGPHGMVTVEANVDTRGNVTATRVISNTTGEESLGALASREIREAKFTPPVRNCAPKAFIFTYKRSF